MRILVLLVTAVVVVGCASPLGQPQYLLYRDPESGKLVAQVGPFQSNLCSAFLAELPKGGGPSASSIACSNESQAKFLPVGVKARLGGLLTDIDFIDMALCKEGMLAKSAEVVSPCRLK